jgi:hypothetical protein
MDMVVPRPRPQGNDDRGNGADLDDWKLKFRKAWARIRARLTDQDIADAQQIAAVSAEALARYDRRQGRWSHVARCGAQRPDNACANRNDAGDQQAWDEADAGNAPETGEGLRIVR